MTAYRAKFTETVEFEIVFETDEEFDLEDISGDGRWFQVMDEVDSDWFKRPDTVDRELKSLEQIDMVRCQLCGKSAPADTAHRHGNGWVGDECCWDERLRSSQ